MNVSRTLTKTSTTSRTAATIMAAVMGLAALTASAHAAGPDRGRPNDGQRHHGSFEAHHDNAGMKGPRGILGLGCGPRAAERIEHALVSLSYRVGPTGDQVKLFDDLKAAAIRAQADVSATCDATLPDQAASGAAPADPARPHPDFIDSMKMRLKLEEARLAALGDLMPQLEAFYSSLTDQQKDALRHRGDRDGHRGGPMDDQGPGDRGPAPQRNG